MISAVFFISPLRGEIGAKGGKKVPGEGGNTQPPFRDLAGQKGISVGLKGTPGGLRGISVGLRGISVGLRWMGAGLRGTGPNNIVVHSCD